MNIKQLEASNSVSFWLNTDDRLYMLARACIQYSENTTIAAKKFILSLSKNRESKTPDGYRYTISSVSAAMEGMK